MYFVCCKILGVEPGADVEKIKSSFRKLAMELHPDHNPSEKASQYFIILQNAYQYLLEHPYNKAEADELLRLKEAEKMRNKFVFHHTVHYNSNPLSTKTLREILKYSPTARGMYVLFHLLFIWAGIYMIYRPIYNIFYYPIDERANAFSAYFVLWFGFVFGVFITITFLYSGIKFIRNR